MRRCVLLLASVVVGAACRESATEPYAPAGPPPAGLPATLAITRRAALPGGPTIEAAGDSLVASVVLGVTGCLDYTGAAGFDHGHLVMTVVATTPAVARVCTADASTGLFRIVVRRAPAGRYAAVLRERIDLSEGPREREVVRQTVTLR